MSYPTLGKSDLDPKQRALWEKLTLGPRGFYTGGPGARQLPDLYNALLQFPELGDIVLQLGDALRSQSELTGRLRELIVLTTSSLLGARIEYEFHVPFARRQGLPDAVVEALGCNRAPEFDDPLDALIYEANVQLVRTATLTDASHTAVVGAIGYRGLMQLIAAVTLYVLTAYVTNTAKAELAKDFSADPEKLQAFYAGTANE